MIEIEKMRTETVTVLHPNGGVSEVVVFLDDDGTLDVNVSPSRRNGFVIALRDGSVLASDSPEVDL